MTRDPTGRSTTRQIQTGECFYAQTPGFYPAMDRLCTQVVAGACGRWKLEVGSCMHPPPSCWSDRCVVVPRTNTNVQNHGWDAFQHIAAALEHVALGLRLVHSLHTSGNYSLCGEPPGDRQDLLLCCCAGDQSWGHRTILYTSSGASKPLWISTSGVCAAWCFSSRLSL